MMLDRVNISQTMSEADTVVGMSLESTVAQPVPVNRTAELPADQSEEEEFSHEDVPDHVADEVVTAEDAAPDEATSEITEEQQILVPSPIIRDMLYLVGSGNHG